MEIRRVENLIFCVAYGFVLSVRPVRFLRPILRTIKLKAPPRSRQKA